MANRNQAKQNEAMKGIRYGIEIETIGQPRQRVAEAIRTVVGGRVEYAGGTYDTWQVVAPDGRIWKAVTDSSLSADRSRQAEVVSPILTYADLDQLQEVVRALRTVAGCKVDSSCGIHVHIDASKFGAAELANLAKVVGKQESLIEHALAVSPRRKATYCQSTSDTFLARIGQARPRTMDDLNRAWYGYLNRSPQHYDQSRYHGLNLHSVWYRGTAEFRWFEGTLHAGKVKAYIQFALALGAKALTAKAASGERRAFTPESAKFDFRVFLMGLGLNGDEFKTARLHLTAGLEGNSSWKHGRPAQAEVA